MNAVDPVGHESVQLRWSLGKPMQDYLAVGPRVDVTERDLEHEAGVAEESGQEVGSQQTQLSGWLQDGLGELLPLP